MIAALPCLPQEHTDFLREMRDNYGFTPNVIYDIGACVLHWTKKAREIWPHASFYLVDGFTEAEPLWKESGYPFHGGVLSDSEKDVFFYVNPALPGGNSYYREVGSTHYQLFFPDSSARRVKTSTLDIVRKEKQWPLPDLVKMDVQGAELDIYKGAQETLRHCKYLILELQHKLYNQGAPFAQDVIQILQKDGWELIAPLFTESEFDGDYCFRNTRV